MFQFFYTNFLSIGRKTNKYLKCDANIKRKIQYFAFLDAVVESVTSSDLPSDSVGFLLFLKTSAFVRLKK